MNPFLLKLQLTRPLAFIDIESTGPNKDTDRIIEIAVCKLFPDGTRETKTRRINPGIPIPASSTEIHGITNTDVAQEPMFAAIANSLKDLLDGCDIAGFASNHFDVPILFTEFLRAGIYWDYTKFKMIDAGNIFKIKEPRTLTAAVAFYTGGTHEEAHSAAADAEATCDVFLAQMEKYEDLPGTIDELHLYCNYGKPFLDLSGKFTLNDAGDIILNFGPKRGEKAKANLDFVDWMYNKANFPPDTRKICEQLLFPDARAFDVDPFDEDNHFI